MNHQPMEPLYLVEKTFGNSSTLLHLERYEQVVRELGEKSPSKRYFKLPPLESLQEVSIEVVINDKSI